jgi:hypothetical protein
MASFGWPLGLFLIATGLGIFSNFISTIIVAEVNRKLLDADQVNYFLWYPGKFSRVKRLHRQFYPQSRMISPLLPMRWASRTLHAGFCVEVWFLSLTCGNQTAPLPSFPVSCSAIVRWVRIRRSSQAGRGKTGHERREKVALQQEKSSYPARSLI